MLRTRKLLILLLLFGFFGIMNPAVAKLTPWMMEQLAASMTGTGWTPPRVEAGAMLSWMQFFQNIPITLVVFVLMFSDTFAKEVTSGTIRLLLTKGLPRSAVVMAKTACMLLSWTGGYALCFAITFGYNAYYWGNGPVFRIVCSAALWCLFAVWVICQVVLFSSFLPGHAGVSICTMGAVLGAYLWTFLPKAGVCSPVQLTKVHALLTGAKTVGSYGCAAGITALLCVFCALSSIPIFRRRSL